MKKTWIFSALVALVLAFPISNLFRNKTITVTASGTDAAEFMPVAEILSQKCADCHSSSATPPWYFSLPGAKGLMESDIQAGLEAWQITASLSDSFGSLSEKQLAKLESSLYVGDMPPTKYKALHWNAGLSENDKEKILTWVRKYRSQKYANPEAAPEFKGEPITPIPQRRELNTAKVALGNKLFHDTRLSGDGTVSCASCHDLKKGGTDQAKFATGIRQQMGDINSPTVLNATFNFLQFWDGRARDLQEQAAGPVANPIEMGATWDGVVKLLKQNANYVASFKKIYGAEITKERVTDAIAVFEDSLITPNSKFDRYLMGDKTALSEDEIKGYELFKTKGCISCHYGVAMGGTHFEKMGRKADYFSKRGDGVHKADNGRYNVTKNESDKHKFKVPTLRNIAITFPYFHDGSETSLSKAIQTMAEVQLGSPLSEKEVAQIEKFLLAQTGVLSE